MAEGRRLFTCRATQIDQYIRWSRGYMSDCEFVARLRGEIPETRAQAAGTALHEWLEKCAPKCVGQEFETIEHGDFSFVFKGNGLVYVPPFAEVKTSFKLDMGTYDAEVRCRIDGLLGNAVVDYKLTSDPDPVRFIESYQWRCYLLATGVREFRWIVFETADATADPVVVKEISVFSAYAYPDMRRDVRRELDNFARAALKLVPEMWVEDRV